MTRFKIGDKVRVKPGGVDIWVKTGKVYEVLDIVVEPEQPPKRLKRYVPPGIEVDCTCEMCTIPIPEKYFLVVDGELGKPVSIFDGCFKPA